MRGAAHWTTRSSWAAWAAAAGMGTLQALLSEMSGLKKPRGSREPARPPDARHEAEASAQVPDPAHLRDEHAVSRSTRRCSARAAIDRSTRSATPPRTAARRRIEYYLAQGAARAHRRSDIDKLATITPYGTGASIKDIVNEGLVVAIRDGRDTITYRPTSSVPSTQAARRARTTSSTSSASGTRRPMHEACHAVVAYRSAGTR